MKESSPFCLLRSRLWWLRLLPQRCWSVHVLSPPVREAVAASVGPLGWQPEREEAVISLRQHKHHIATLALAVLLAGCSSTGTVKVDKPATGSIDHRATAAVLVSADSAIKNKEGVSEAVRRLRGQLFGRLMSEGVFRQVVHPGEPARYKVEATLLGATEVSQSSRILFGVLAGANELSVRVEVFEQGQPAPIMSLVAKGESASHPMSSQNDMDDAIREVVDEVVLLLQK